jgi:hypothetical protein
MAAFPMNENATRIGIILGAIMVGIIVFCTMFQNFRALLLKTPEPAAISRNAGE